MRWRMILEEFGPDIRHISGVDNIVADAISRLPTANKDEEEPRTEVQRLNEMFINNEANDLLAENDESFPLDLLQVREAQQEELNKKQFQTKASSKN